MGLISNESSPLKSTTSWLSSLKSMASKIFLNRFEFTLRVGDRMFCKSNEDLSRIFYRFECIHFYGNPCPEVQSKNRLCWKWLRCKCWALHSESLSTVLRQKHLSRGEWIDIRTHRSSKCRMRHLFGRPDTTSWVFSRSFGERLSHRNIGCERTSGHDMGSAFEFGLSIELTIQVLHLLSKSFGKRFTEQISDSFKTVSKSISYFEFESLSLTGIRIELD